MKLQRQESFGETLAQRSMSQVGAGFGEAFLYVLRVHGGQGRKGAILADYRLQGDRLWARFDGDSDQLWYYGALVDAFQLRSQSPMVAELDRVVSELRSLACPPRPSA